MTLILENDNIEKLIKANEANYQSYIRTYAAVKGNRVIENSEVMLSISKENGISMINNCVAKTLTTEAGAEKVFQSYKKAGKPVLWTVFPSAQPGNLEKIFKKKRMIHLERNSLMYFDMSALNTNSEKQLDYTIKEVDDFDSLKDWTKLNAICFNLTPDVQKFIREKAAALFLDKSLPGRHFIAYKKNKPIGTSSVYLSDGVTGIYNVTTLPEARGRGIGEAVTRAALIFGKKAGYRYAILQATQKGLPVYKKMGFHSEKHMDYYVKFYGRSLFIIPLYHLAMTIGNTLRQIFLKP